MKDQSSLQFALMRHHAGWADVFQIETETTDSVTGFYPDRERTGPPVTYSLRAVLCRFKTADAAHAARETGVAEWRKHDLAVSEAEKSLEAAKAGREQAWADALTSVADRA